MDNTNHKQEVRKTTKKQLLEIHEQCEMLQGVISSNYKPCDEVNNEIVKLMVLLVDYSNSEQQ